jgi:hypothetical protein
MEDWVVLESLLSVPMQSRYGSPAGLLSVTLQLYYMYQHPPILHERHRTENAELPGPVARMLALAGNCDKSRGNS